ncbi:MAG TPA: alpha,alpha-trehalose-phosphate synthase (UDP-forming) [Ferrovibrio sp.]|uniref:alpha,alpha-trehalose-phosphate synthase (UDP-forming) n=1 Tax=Ferrovibrio sp. TaxID=1917215 RepID=UPI002ED50A9C
MARLVIVSNRVSMPRERLSRAGGLAVAIREALNQYGGLWFGWSGEMSATPDGEPRKASQGRVEFAVIDLTPEEHRLFYLEFANSILWPLCHYRLGLIDFSRAAWEGYLAVNDRFADVLARQLQPDDIIWVHDYHFIPMAAALRRRGVANRIGFFLHVPFPAPEVLAALPGHERLVRDLCAYDLVGFQTKNDVRALTEYILHEVNGQVGDNGHIAAFGRTLQVAAFPIGIDTEGFAKLGAAAADGPEALRLRDSLAGRSLVIGVDRLDYSKGIPQRFEAFYDLLSNNSEFRGKVTFMQVAPISRGEVMQYRKLRNELDALTGRINGKFAEFDWVPVRYLNKSFPRQHLAAFYRVARVGLITPLRDGMNLVAKEYVAAQDPEDPGVLVLSRFAGAAREMGGAVIVNPYDPEHLAEALARALKMPLEERAQRWRYNMDVLRNNTITHWRERFLKALNGPVS